MIRSIRASGYRISAVAVLATWTAVAAQSVSRQEALAAAYPGADIVSERVFLTAEQRHRAAEVAAREIPSALIARYLASRDGVQVGRAYVDTHLVRTKKESLLICLDASGRVRRIEVTAFLEPPEYQASPAWYRQFEGRGLDGDLNLNRGIRPMAGATLTAAAANQAVRRVLAIDQVLEQPGTSRETGDRKPAEMGKRENRVGRVRGYQPFQALVVPDSRALCRFPASLLIREGTFENER
ncbi:MAG: hypothetical protein V3T83_21045 [Acidobacteriota bacterium]